MVARQRRSKSALTKLHECAGSLPPSARPEAFDQCYLLRQLQCPAKRLSNRNLGKDFVVCSAECSAVHPW